MRTLKNIYFYTTTHKWASVPSSFDKHKVRFLGKLCYFDGYTFIDMNGDTYNYREENFEHKAGDKFKLLSTITSLNGEKNYLGMCVKTKRFITFSETQIVFNHPITSNNNEE